MVAAFLLERPDFFDVNFTALLNRPARPADPATGPATPGRPERSARARAETHQRAGRSEWAARAALESRGRAGCSGPVRGPFRGPRKQDASRARARLVCVRA